MASIFVKLHVDILGDPKLMQAASDGCTALDLLPWLLAYAKKTGDRGRLSVNSRVAGASLIASYIPGKPTKRVQRALSEFENIGVLVRDADDVLRFAKWDERAEGKPSDAPSAVYERVKRHRAKERAAATPRSESVSETPGNADDNALHETPDNARELEKEREEEKEKEIISKKSRRPSPDVDAVLAHYVRVHPGTRPGDDAKRHVRKALRSYSAAELCAAIDGNSIDPWCVKATKHEFSYIFKDNGSIDRFRTIAARPVVDGNGVLTDWGRQISGGAL